MSAEGAAASSSDSSEKIEIVAKASELLAQGKRNMVCGEIPKAVNLYEEAVQMLVTSCGELSRDCADAYFNCGSALLELGRMETSVLGAALDGVDVEEEKEEEANEQFEKPPESEGDERQKLREEVYEAMAVGEREEEFQKAVLEKCEKVCAEAAQICEKSQEMVDCKMDKVTEKSGKIMKVELMDSSEPVAGKKDDVNAAVSTDIAPTQKDVVNAAIGNDIAPQKDVVNAAVSNDIKPPEKDTVNDVVSNIKSPQKDVVNAAVSKDIKPPQNDVVNAAVSTDIKSPQKDVVDAAVGNDIKSPQKDVVDAAVCNIKSPQNDVNAAVSKDIKPPVQNNDETTEKHEDAANSKDKDIQSTEKSEDKSSSDTDKQVKEEMIIATCNESSQDSSNVNETLSSCGGMKTVVHGSTDGAENKEIVETEIVKTAERKELEVTVECQDAEMADKDATEDVEEDDAEDEEESITEDKEGEEIEGEEKEEDVPNFQLAWEYLDLAKVIYLKSESADDQLKVAECHIKLGEISMETEQHVTAAEDIECALKIQQKLLPADDRLIAETHYQLGLAYGLGKDFALAIQHYTKAIGVVEAKIVSLKKLLELAAVDEDNKENQESDHAKKYKDEIKELQELIPEMRNKIDDAREESKDMDKMKQMAIEALGFSGPSKNFASPTKRTESNAGDKSTDVDENGEKKATDIAHLIRKKRKPEDDQQVTSDQDIKKIRHDDGSAVAAAALDVKRIEPTPAEQGTS